MREVLSDKAAGVMFSVRLDTNVFSAQGYADNFYLVNVLSPVIFHSLYVTEEKGRTVPMTSNTSHHSCLRNVACCMYIIVPRAK